MTNEADRGEIWDRLRALEETQARISDALDVVESVSSLAERILALEIKALCLDVDLVRTIEDVEVLQAQVAELINAQKTVMEILRSNLKTQGLQTKAIKTISDALQVLALAKVPNRVGR